MKASETTKAPVLSGTVSIGTLVALEQPGLMLRDGARLIPSRGECVFRVERLQQEYADIATEDRTVRGWVEIRRLLPLDRALEHFSQRIARDSKDAEALRARGQIWIEKEEWDRALLDLEQVLQLAPERDRALAAAVRDHGLVLDAKRRFDQAFAELTQAIRLDPDHPGLVLARGRVCALRGRHTQGMADIDWYIRSHPGDPAGYVARGEALLANLESEPAIAEFTRALALDPTSLTALHRRAQAWRVRREFARTVEDYAEATRLAPNDPFAHRALAWILATCIRPEVRDGPRAVREATIACEVTGWNDLNCLIALAAAHAEAGDFIAAQKRQADVLRRLPRDDKKQLDLHEARLILFQRQRPYRD